MAAAANQKARQVVEEDLANVEFETSEDVEVIPTFDSMGLREDLLRGIYAYGMITSLKFCKPIDSGCLSLGGSSNHSKFNLLLYILGFEKPSAIQQRAIRPLLKGRDVIAQAQSGTGKTATFSISILQSIDTTVRETQVSYSLCCTSVMQK